jgi:deoxyribodipyrimidine photo-lyase
MTEIWKDSEIYSEWRKQNRTQICSRMLYPYLRIILYNIYFMPLKIPTPIFPIDRASIESRIDAIDPIRYGKSRNYVDGAVTYLSPYISRGFVTIGEIRTSILARGYKSYQIEQFLKELAWREYFLRVWESLGTEKLMTDIRFDQEDLLSYDMPRAFLEKNTGIDSFDRAIEILEEIWYMHNHLRMYIAGTITNMSHTHWRTPAKWLYSHLLDGDIASNTLSWQWNAGVFSSKKYIANQENIDQYTGSSQKWTFLDRSYDDIWDTTVPKHLQEFTPYEIVTPLPESDTITLDPEKSLCIYTDYWINTNWMQDIEANRILVLSPSHYQRFPVTKKVIDFIIWLARENIPGIQVFIWEIEELRDQFRMISEKEIFLIDHVLYRDISWIVKSPYPYMIPQVSGYFPSFFTYWKISEKYMMR